MPKPRLLGIEYAAKAAPVPDGWLNVASHGNGPEQRFARARLRSLQTFESRARTNALTAGHPVARDRWPQDLADDYGSEIPNLFRLELAGRWRGYYTLVGESDGARIWVLYLWDHGTYSKQSGYSKK